MDISKTIPRPIAEDAPEKERHQAQRKIDEELARRAGEVAENVPGSKFDEIEFQSLGDGVEIRIDNPFPWIPNRRSVISQHGDWTLWNSRDDLADENFIYLSTVAPAGEKFIVRFWRS